MGKAIPLGKDIRLAAFATPLPLSHCLHHPQRCHFASRGPRLAKRPQLRSSLGDNGEQLWDENTSEEEMIAKIVRLERERREKISGREGGGVDDVLRKKLWERFPQMKEMEEMMTRLLEKEKVGELEDLVFWIRNRIFRKNDRRWGWVMLALAASGGWLIGRLARSRNLLVSLIWMDRVLSVWILGAIPAMVFFVALLKKLVHSDVVNRLMVAYFATMSYTLSSISLVLAGKYRLALGLSGVVRAFGVRTALWRWHDYNEEMEVSWDRINIPFRMWRWVGTAFAVVTGSLRLLALLPLQVTGIRSYPANPAPGLGQLGVRLTDFFAAQYTVFSSWMTDATSFHSTGLIGALTDPTRLLGARLNLRFPVALGALADRGCMLFLGTLFLAIYISYLVYWATFGTDVLSERRGRKVRTPLRSLLERFGVLQRDLTRDEMRRLVSAAPDFETCYKPSEFWFWKEPETLFTQEKFWLQDETPAVIPLIELFEKKGIFEENKRKEREVLYNDNESDVKGIYNALADWAAPADPNFSWDKFTNPLDSEILGGVQASMAKTTDDKEDHKAVDSKVGCVLGEDEVAKIVGWSSSPISSDMKVSQSPVDENINLRDPLCLDEWDVEFNKDKVSEDTSLVGSDSELFNNHSPEDHKHDQPLKDHEGNGTVYSV